VRIAVLSGKGGTGKTTISTNLAHQMKFGYVDLDVEEPNGHIFLKPEQLVSTDVEIPTPKIDAEKCTLCSACVNACQFNALINTGRSIKVFADLCHGCGACTLACPEGAITEHGRIIGKKMIGQYEHGSFHKGLLNISEPMAGPIIADIKKSLDQDADYLIDCSPGTSCNVVKALDGADYALLVTEPSNFGLHDLKLAVQLVQEMDMPHGIVINRSNEYDEIVDAYANEESIEIVGRIPFSRASAKLYSQGKLISEDPDIHLELEKISSRLKEVIGCN
jgi:MinD superfamily P-loop ATPase